MTAPPSKPASSVDLDPEIMVEFERFYRFVYEVILPAEPQTHVALSPKHHRAMYYACKNYTALAAPRGFIKSTIFSRFRILHLLVAPKYAKEEIMMISETADLVKDHMDWIKWHLLHNKEIERRYPGLVDRAKLKWNEDELEVTNGCSLKVKGYGGQIRGFHPTRIFVDDIESLKNIGTDESLKKLKSWFKRVVMGAMTPETTIHVVGTIISPKSLLDDIIHSEGWHGVCWKALDESTSPPTSIWPQRWSVEYLLKRRRSLGTHEFNAEYQNAPLSVGDIIVQPEWIRYHEPHQISHLRPIARYIGVDPAFTEERWGDYSAIVVLEQMQNNELYERVAWRKKVGGPELIATIERFYNYYRADGVPCHLGVEEVQAQKMIRQAIQEKDPTINVIPLKPDGDKPRRLINVSRYFEMGMVSLMTKALGDEVVAFPSGEKDRVDALVWALRLFEMNSPLVVKGETNDLDSLKHLDDTSLGVHMDLALMGVPGKHVPKEYRQRLEDFQELQAMVEEYEDFY